MTASSARHPPAPSELLQREYEELLSHLPKAEMARQQSKQRAAAMARTPTISVVMPIHRSDVGLLREAICSVLHQTYKHWTLFLVHDGPQSAETERLTADFARVYPQSVFVLRQAEQRGISEATNAGIRAADGDYVAFLDHDDLLDLCALERIASAIVSADAPPDMVYTDHDKIDMQGRRFEPEFKPDWSPETLLAFCYVGHCKVVRRSLLLELGGLRKDYDSAQDYDLVLRLAERTDRVVRVPEILYHWRTAPGSTALSAANKVGSRELGRAAVEDALRRRGKRGTPYFPPFADRFSLGVHALRFDPRQFTERVTIIIPTKDRLDLLEPCIRSIKELTTYPHYDILVVSNGSTERKTFDFLEREDVRWIDVPTSGFNFSAVVNAGVRHAKTPLVLLLNNDTEIIDGDWLTRMVGTLSLDDRIGAVGAKLLYPDGRIQHAGVVLGLHDGTAGHAYKLAPAEEPGYRNAVQALRNYSVVTGACLLTRADSFRNVGGFDEQCLPISYNDVDYCLKLLARGERVVYVPDAVLRHREAASRKSTMSAQKEYEARSHLRRMWKPLLRRDPYYNPNLSLADGNFHLRSHPRGKKILLVSHNLNYEGASLSLFDLARMMKARDYHLEVVCGTTGPLARAYEQLGIAVHTPNASGAHPLTIMNKDAFDIVFLNTITTADLLKTPDIDAKPIVWCIRESEREQYFQTLTGLSGQQLLGVSRVVFVADATRKIYIDLDDGQFETIHNGIDLRMIDDRARRSDRQAIRRELAVPDGDTVITIVGTICERKGQRGFAEAAAHLLARYSGDLTFFIVGGTGSAYENEVRRMIESLGLGERVRIIPTTPDVHRYYAASDIFVCNSSMESFPRVVLEAMAWSLPIVATNVYGIPEQITHEAEGLLIPPNDSRALAAALRRLMDDQDFARALGENARRRVEKSFDIETMADRYDALFRSLSRDR